MIVAELTCRPRRMISIRRTTLGNISLGMEQSNQQKLPEITTSFYYLICPTIASCLPACCRYPDEWFWGETGYRLSPGCATEIEDPN